MGQRNPQNRPRMLGPVTGSTRGRPFCRGFGPGGVLTPEGAWPGAMQWVLPGRDARGCHGARWRFESREPSTCFSVTFGSLPRTSGDVLSAHSKCRGRFNGHTPGPCQLMRRITRRKGEGVHTLRVPGCRPGPAIGAASRRSFASLRMTVGDAQDDRGPDMTGKVPKAYGRSRGFLGKVLGVFGEGLVLRPGPSPAILYLRALWGHISGEDTPLKHRPSPKHTGTFPAERRQRES